MFINLNEFICSAIIDHTNQVLYLEDNDVAAVGKDGRLTIHRLSSCDDPSIPTCRELITLKLEIQQLMKGLFILLEN